MSFTASAGAGMPSLVLDQNGTNVTLVLGPFWFLQDAQFAAAAGDRIEAIVLACTNCPSGYAVLSVKNLTSGANVILRDSAGVPLWQSHGPQRGGKGYGNCDGMGPDLTKTATFTGAVVSFTGGPGIGRPTLVLNTDTGEKTFIAGPYRIIADSGLELTAGKSLTITAAPNVRDEWVVVSIKDNATGAELVLR